MDPATYLDHLRADGAALGSAAGGALERPVPTCPEWDVAELVRHVGKGHRWFADIVRTRATEGHWRFPQAPAEGGVLLAWYDEGLAALVDVLKATDPDEPVWNWFDDTPAPALFWHRRVAQETSVHRWDAQFAVGDAQPFDADLAVDGIDEHLSFIAFGLPVKPVEGLSGSLHLHATDVEGEWSLKLAPDQLDHDRSHTKADAAVRGPASDLLLWLVNRQPPQSPVLEVFGDDAIIDAWRSVRF